MGEDSGYRKLIVWRKSNALALEIYKITRKFPKDEIYGIISQLRRASLSVPTNLVEGHGRQNPKEMKRFVKIALGSLAETEYLLGFSKDLELLSSEEYDQIERDRSEVGRLLFGFFKKL